jgi:hypothetical protein
MNRIIRILRALIEAIGSLPRIADSLELIGREIGRPVPIHLHPITRLHLQEITMLPIAPGSSPQFTVSPVPVTSIFSTPPTWTTSDTVNAPITIDSTGTVATVAIPLSATVGASFTLSATYTNPDGSIATGTTSQTIVAGTTTSTNITVLIIEQTA